MSVTPAMILESARVLCDGGSAEVDWRNAISRAYYGAFHGCRELAQRIDPLADLSTPSAHQDVAVVLQQRQSGSDARAVSYQLTACRRMRNRADYELDEDFDQRTCRAVVEMCGTILERVAGLGAGLPG